MASNHLKKRILNWYSEKHGKLPQIWSYTVCPDTKVRSHCHLVFKVRNIPESARGLIINGTNLLLFLSSSDHHRLAVFLRRGRT